MRTGLSQRVIRQIQETIERRQLFRPDDKLLIGISGGKDSLTLLDCLFQAGYQNLHSIHVKIDKTVTSEFYGFCTERSDFTVVESDILKNVKQQTRRNHCYMCSRARRKAICQYAIENGFTKLVFAHHKNDAVETMLLNLLFQREFSTMLSLQELFKGRLEIVRPLYDIDQKAISKYAKLEKLPVTNWNCGLEKNSRRAWVRDQIYLWQKAFPKLDMVDNLFTTMQNVNTDFITDYKNTKQGPSRR